MGLPPSNIWNDENNILQTHNQGLRQLLLTVPLRLAQHTWWCPCISVVLEAMQEAKLRAIEGRCVRSKSLSRVQDRDVGSCLEERKRKGFPQQGVIELPS